MLRFSGRQVVMGRDFAPVVTVRRDAGRRDGSTWEVWQPDDRRSEMRRFDRRTRSILTVAAVAAIVVNAGAGWAYWEVTKSPTALGRAGTAVQLTPRGRSDLTRPLAPGGIGDLTVMLTNDTDSPIRITAVASGPGAVVADEEHRAAGCRTTGVSMTKREFAVSWSVARNTIGAFTVPGGLRMAADSKPVCEGATFSIPLRTSGVTGRS